MTLSAHRTSSRVTAILFVSAIFVIVILTTRNCGLNPRVFDDEWIYSKYSRLAPMSGAPVPSYLFFILFGMSRYCGDSFLEFARILNACFFAIAFLLIYLICRKYGPWQLSLFVSLLSVLAPISSYSAYFMPESMYFCAFWFLTWFLLRNVNESPLTLGTGAGAILALMAMIKAHAIFLLPGFAAFVLLAWITKSSKQKLGSSILSVALAMIVFAVVRLSAGYLAAGDAGLHLMGQRYGAVMDSSIQSRGFSEILWLTRTSLIGHLLTLALLFGLPLAVIPRKPEMVHEENGTVLELQHARLLVIAFLFPSLIVAGLSTALFAGGSAYDTIERLHLRYYDFMFPLLFIIVIGELKSARERKSRSLGSLLVALIVGSTALYALSGGLKNYSPNLADSPELLIFYQPNAFIVVGILGILSLLFWAMDRAKGALFYLLVFLPLTTIASAYWVNARVRDRILPNPYDEAGQFAHHCLGTEASKLAIVASDPIGLYNSLFYVDNPDASIIQIPAGARLDRSKIPTGKTWVLLIGDHEPPSGIRHQFAMGTYFLFNLSQEDVVDFRNMTWPGILTSISGISDPENFGRWSDADEVRINFAEPLPKKIRLVLKAKAFGPNIGLLFKIAIGQQEQEFRLSDSLIDVSLLFDSSGIEKTVTIKVPKPISPNELLNLPDYRRIGIALQQLSILDIGERVE